MFGGNQTERRQRRERLWTGAGALLGFGGVWWFVATDDRTDATETWLFWGTVLVLGSVTATVAWKNADKEALPMKGSVTWAAAGILLSNLLEDLFWVKVIMFAALAGLLLGGALGLLGIVLIRPHLTHGSGVNHTSGS